MIVCDFFVIFLSVSPRYDRLGIDVYFGPPSSLRFEGGGRRRLWQIGAAVSPHRSQTNLGCVAKGLEALSAFF